MQVLLNNPIMKVSVIPTKVPVQHTLRLLHICMEKAKIFCSCWELNPRLYGPVTTLFGMASLSAPQASITMVIPNRNYELKKPQLFIEFHYILFITVKSEYRKSHSNGCAFDSAASLGSCTTCALLLPWLYCWLHWLCYPSSHGKAHHYENGRGQVVSQPVVLKGRSYGSHIY